MRRVTHRGQVQAAVSVRPLARKARRRHCGLGPRAADPAGAPSPALTVPRGSFQSIVAPRAPGDNDDNDARGPGRTPAFAKAPAKPADVRGWEGPGRRGAGPVFRGRRQFGVSGRSPPFLFGLGPAWRPLPATDMP